MSTINITDWDSKSAYSSGATVRYWGGYYRATRDISAPWFFNNDAPDSSDAWVRLSPDQAAALLGYNSLGETTMRKISGPALCGFADHFETPSYGAHPLVGHTPSYGAHPIVGAGKPPVQRKPYPKAKQSNTVAQHAQVLKQARQVLAKAHGQVKTAAKKTLATPAAPVSRGARSGPRSVHGLIGVASPAAQAKVKAAVAKAQAAKGKAAQAAKVAAAKTQVAHKTVTQLAQQIKSHEGVARKLSGKTSHGVHGVGADWVHPLNPKLYIGDAPSNPPDPSLDPSLSDPSSTPIPAPASPQLDLDTLVSAMPAGQAPFDQYIPDCTKVPSIVYDGSKGLPDGFLGSAYLFTRQTDIGCEPDTAQIEGNAHFGYVWGKYDKSDPANGGVGWGSHLQSAAWNHVHGRYYLGDDSWHETVSTAEALQSNTKTVDPGAPGAHCSGYQTGGQYGGSYGDSAKFKQTYGPLVGNPAMPDFKGLRSDANGVIFWIASEAPDWATFPLKAAAALTKAAADKAAKDAAAADAAATAKAAADAAAAQAAQAAQNALDEANAVSQAAQQQSAAQGQSAQAAAEYDTADAAAASAASASAAQDVEERKQALAQQQAMFQAQMQQQQAPPDDGGGYSSGDDGGSPESDSQDEADAIESGGDDTDVVGELHALEVQLRKRELADDLVIGGDGEVIGIDEWGNEL